MYCHCDVMVMYFNKQMNVFLLTDLIKSTKTFCWTNFVRICIYLQTLFTFLFNKTDLVPV